MKSFSNLEKSIIKDIIFTILVVLVTIPVWLSFDVSASESIAKEYANYNYVNYKTLNDTTFTFDSINDVDALREVETKDILVYNDSNTVDDYSLVLKINKNDDINLNNIRINVNYNIKSLIEYPSFEDENAYYFVIDSKNIVAKSLKYTISMWSKENTNKQNINYEFLLENSLYA